MSEADRRRDAQIVAIFEELEAFSAPASPWERDLVAEIDAAPSFWVSRLPPDRIAQLPFGMRDCHNNCRAVAANDAEGKTRAVTGWWKQPSGVYLLHSVVERDGRYRCVTPIADYAPDRIIFSPDPKLVWRHDGRTWSCWRGDRLMGFGVRARPEELILECERIRERLRSGMDPLEAVRADEISLTNYRANLARILPAPASRNRIDPLAAVQVDAASPANLVSRLDDIAPLTPDLDGATDPGGTPPSDPSNLTDPRADLAC